MDLTQFEMPEELKDWIEEQEDPDDATEELGEPAVTELLLDWLDPFITRVERDRIVAWRLGVSL